MMHFDEHRVRRAYAILDVEGKGLVRSASRLRNPQLSLPFPASTAYLTVWWCVQEVKDIPKAIQGAGISAPQVRSMRPPHMC
jgi:hypothetical protein